MTRYLFNEDEAEETDSRDTRRDLCLAHHVARGLRGERDPEIRALAWFLHAFRIRLGSFDEVASLILKVVPDVLGTPKMKNAGQLNADQIEQCAHAFSENARGMRDFCLRDLAWGDPLQRRCPGTSLLLIEVLKRFRAAWAARAHARLAETAIRRRVWAALDHARVAGPGITIIQGDTRTGKTVAAEAWTDANLDCARLLKLESGLCDSAFFADVNRAFGNGSAKVPITRRLRATIREVIDARDLMLIIDEGQWLWEGRRASIPKSINWMMTGIVNRGGSVVLIATPQFMQDMERVSADTKWTVGQWKGRIVKFERLPPTIPDNELQLVAEQLFPEGASRDIRALMAIAKASPGYLSVIADCARSARLAAQLEGVRVGSAHLTAAIQEKLELVRDLGQVAESVRPGRKGHGKSTRIDAPVPAAPDRSFSAPPSGSTNRLQGGLRHPPDLVNEPVRALSEIP